MIYEKINNNEFKNDLNYDDDFIECSFCNQLFSISETILCDLCNFFYCKNDYDSHFNLYHFEDIEFEYNCDINRTNEIKDTNEVKNYFLSKEKTEKNIIENKEKENYNFIKKDLEIYFQTKKEYLFLNNNFDLLNICETCGFPCFLNLKYERFSNYSYFNLFLITQCKLQHMQEINLNHKFCLEKKCKKCQKKIIDNYFYIISSKEFFCKKCFNKSDFSLFNLKKINYLNLSKSKENYKQRLEAVKNKINEVSNFLDNFIKNFKDLIEKKINFEDSILLNKEINLFENKNKNLLYISNLLLEKYEYDLNHNCLTNETNESFKNILNFNSFDNFSNFTKENFLGKTLIESLIAENNLILKITKNNNNNENKIKKIINYSDIGFLFVKPLKNGNFIISFNIREKIFIEIFKYPNYDDSNERLINISSTKDLDYIINIFELSNNNFILQTKKNNLYFLEEKQIFSEENLTCKNFPNLLNIFPKNKNFYYVFIKENDIDYLLNEYEKNELKNTKKFKNFFIIEKAFYFKEFDFIFFYENKKIGNYNINKNKVNEKDENLISHNFKQIKNQMLLLQYHLIICYDVTTLEKVSIFKISNKYIDLKALNYNTLIALDSKNFLIHLDSIFSMNEIKKIKFFIDVKFFILKNGILYLKDNVIAINCDLID